MRRCFTLRTPAVDLVEIFALLRGPESEAPTRGPGRGALFVVQASRLRSQAGRLHHKYARSPTKRSEPIFPFQNLKRSRKEDVAPKA